MDEKKKSLTEAHKQHREEHWSDWNNRNWRAWGSWFSWGSPIGLSLFYAIIVLSTGVFLWLIHQY